jgi:hypothetical protein
MEHRWGQRVPCGAAVRVLTGSGVFGTGKLRNVSSSGAYIETSMDLHLLARLSVAVVRDDPQREIEILASILRVDRDGVGIEWFDPTGDSICRAFGCTSSCAAA